VIRSNDFVVQSIKQVFNAVAVLKD